MTTNTVMTLDELYEEFDFLGDWEDRCDFLIDLGFELPKLSDSAKIDRNKVQGCQSNVWMVCELKQDPPTVEIFANSDAMIVNGLIAVLLAVFNGKTPEEILNTDVNSILKKLELDRHLSSARKNGLSGMVNRVREFAAHAQVALNAAEDE